MRFFCIFSLLFVFSGVTVAQDYVLNMGGGDILEGESGDLAVTFDNNALDVQGWSFGACNDTAFLQCTGVADGATTLVVKNGSPPDFNETNVTDDGFTTGVVICFTGCAVLAPGSGYELYIATYAALAEGTTEVAFCDTLGSPPVATVVVVDGASIAPTQNSGTVNITVPPPVPDPEFGYHAEDASANYNPADGNASVTVAYGISEVDNSGLGAPFPNDTQGFSMGVSNGSEVTPVAVTPALPFTPDFFEDNTYPTGWTVGAVYSFTGGVVLAFPAQADVLTVDYDTAGSMAGDEDGATVALIWDSGIGSPPVANVVVVDGASLPPTFNDGSITLNAVVTLDFIRGDVNADNIVNIADGVWIIYELFLDGPVSTCPIARDANGDGSVDLGDGVFVLNYRFLDGPAPSAPFPDCGQNPDQTPEDCASSFCG